MRFATSLCFGVLAAAILAASARGQNADDEFRLYAVHIHRSGYDKSSGFGVYLGRGVVLTAAHVAGLGIWREPKVEIAGKMLPATVLKDGHFYRQDLELLAIDEQQLPVSLALRRMPICGGPLLPGQPVVVATPENAVRSRVVPPEQLARIVAPEYRTAIAFVAESGASGSGVFDANKKCLLGIIARIISGNRIMTKDGRTTREPFNIAKYFVPAAEIAAFIPKTVRF